MNRATVLHGDCREVLRTLDADSIDACVCDPPYEIGFMSREWDQRGVTFEPATWAEVLRVLKPGSHLVALGGTRTYHRMVCAIEDAGFEVRDQLAWIYGSGFPKSHSIGKAIDRMAGAEREVVGISSITGARQSAFAELRADSASGFYGDAKVNHLTAPATPEAAAWEGWGTALKPSHEPIVLARKPLSEPTVAANVLRWGTGALNIDATRVPAEHWGPSGKLAGGDSLTCYGDGLNNSGRSGSHAAGRWPANLCHSGDEEVLAAFDLFGERTSGARSGPRKATSDTGWGSGTIQLGGGCQASTGSAARFFQSCPLTPEELRFHYSAKADATGRAGSSHPTIKPLALMEWLVRLVTPPGGVVLDCFAGTGVTGEACLRQSFRAVLIEQDAAYCADVRHRLGRMAGADTPLFSAA